MDEIVKVEKYSVQEDNSLLSEFDDYVANDRIGGATSRALRYGFEVGDMVWGKVKSHPWWPGLIFNEAFASPSVRRTRREGHVLVAFFGDSSYGWFDPAELIPFEPHFEDKSQQTYSRNFMRAVEEAVDEASRRSALGVACKCRNPYNFRPTNVRGYFAVDVPDYEPNGLYSMNQISKSRSSFEPAETLAFVKQLAVRPQGVNRSGIEFIKNRAGVFAFRKAVFEEFDETYAQAFGVQPARPSNDPLSMSYQPVKQPPRAPLSGPLVIAETLGGDKSSKKPAKVKNQSKKEGYLLKRRDESSDANNLHGSLGKACSIEPAYVEGPPAFFAGDYVLQKRAPVAEMPSKYEPPPLLSTSNGAGSSRDVAHNDFSTLDQAAEGRSLEIKPALPKEELRILDGARITSESIKQEGDDMVDNKPEDDKFSGSYKGYQKHDLNLSQQLQVGQGFDKVWENHVSGHIAMVDEKPPDLSMDGAMKKKKALKRPSGDLSPNSTMLGKKKKKKKNQKELEAKSDRSENLSTGKAQAGLGNLFGKSTQTGLAFGDDVQVNLLKRDAAAAANSLYTSAGVSSTISIGSSGLELTQLLSDLHSLALHPFHGMERNCPTIIRQFFLRFRSLVYQKSLVLSPSSDMEPIESRTAKPPSSVSAPDDAPGENVRDSNPSKLVRPIVKPDDLTKAGRKRLPSDRIEEIATKRLKKISQLKSLAAERKTGQRAVEVPRVEPKEQPLATPVKPFKRPDLAKKVEPPVKAVEPTMLVMKFPPQTSLPSVAELKARFGRFGSLDQSAIRVFWKSSTCRVVFRHKTDAQAAYRYANANKSLFGNVNVRFHLRTVEGPASEVSEFDRTRGDDTSESVRTKDSVADRLTSAVARRPVPQPAVQLKSCLKKPTSDEVAQVAGGNGGKGTPRVKFILGGEETSSNITNRGEQMMGGNRSNNNNNASFAGGGTPAVAMEFNTSENFQKVPPPSSSSILPLLPQFAKAPALVNNVHQAEVAVPRKSHNLNTPTDISQQMLSLLTRCNDVVTNLSGLLGYVPYHPL